MAIPYVVFADKITDDARTALLGWSVPAPEPVPEVTGDPHAPRSEEHTSELQSRENLVCRLLRPPTSTHFPYTPLFRSHYHNIGFLDILFHLYNLHLRPLQWQYRMWYSRII